MQLLSVGIPQTLTQNVIFALPSFLTSLCSNDTLTLQFSNNPTFATFVIQGIPNAGQMPFAFVRNPSPDTVVMLRRFMSS